MKKLIIILAAAAMAGCGIYKPYTRPEEIKTAFTARESKRSIR